MITRPRDSSSLWSTNLYTTQNFNFSVHVTTQNTYIAPYLLMLNLNPKLIDGASGCSL